MKKLYTNILLQLSIILSLFNMGACTEDSINSQPQGSPKILTDAQKSYIVAPAASTIEFSINSNTTWKIDSDQPWCKVTPNGSVSSSLVSTISVSLETNTDWKQRSVYLKITGEGVEEEKVIAITQSGRDEFAVEPFEGTVAREGGVALFKIISNRAWNVSTEDSYITINNASGNGNEDGTSETFSLTFGPNAGVIRTGKIVISTETFKQEFLVIQDGCTFKLEDPTQSEIKLTGELEETIIKMNANVEWKIILSPADAEWITAVQNKNELTLQFKRNKLFIPRTSVVTITPKEELDGAEDINIHLVQSVLYESWNGATVNESGYYKLTSANVGGTSIHANYVYKRSHLTFEFEEINLSAGSELLFNMDGEAVNGSRTFYNYKLKIDGGLTTRNIIRSDGTWDGDEQSIHLTADELKAVKKLEIIIDDDLTNQANIRYRILINGVEKACLSGKVNPFKLNLGLPGYGMYIQCPQITPGDYVIIKSINYESYE